MAWTDEQNGGNTLARHEKAANRITPPSSLYNQEGTKAGIVQNRDIFALFEMLIRIKAIIMRMIVSALGLAHPLLDGVTLH